MPKLFFDQRLSRREALLRLGGTALGGLALGIAGTPKSAAARPKTAIAPVASYSSEVATDWFRLVLHLVQTTPGFSPPVASRAFGYLGVALYEALVPGMWGYRSLAHKLNSLPHFFSLFNRACHWPSVANATLAASARSFFPTTSAANLAAIDALERSISETLSFDLPPGIAKRSVNRGRAVASHIYNWSKTDGGHEGYLRNFPDSYIPPVGDGLWIPTPPGFQRALQPYWGENRPFVLNSGVDHDPGPPPAYTTESDSTFYMEALEVFETVNNLTAEQEAIALFWADDPGATSTPPGHSLTILTQLLEDWDASLEVAAESYAKAGISVADAFISCWHCKYTYNLIRPISYIQQHPDFDPEWGTDSPPLPVTTPPFPEYTSGHSVQTGAFAQVMEDLFGDLTFTDHTHDARGLAPRTFHSWSQMSAEAAISRLYGGIHFRSAIDLGVEQGRQIGREVSAIRLRRR